VNKPLPYYAFSEFTPFLPFRISNLQPPKWQAMLFESYLPKIGIKCRKRGLVSIYEAGFGI
jgi:hypothetical protein